MKYLATHGAAALIGGITTIIAYHKLLSQKEDEATKPTIVQLSDNSSPSIVSIVASTSNKSPTLPIAIFRPNPNLEIVFDTRTRNPLYVLEILDKNHLKKTSKRQNQRFKEETSLKPSFRSRNGFYKNSGYDRGHLAPAADFPSEVEDTFTLCNVSPQNASLNRTLWAKLERLIRQIAEEEEGATYVVTGPLWLPRDILSSKNTQKERYQFRYESIGNPPSLISVPTHFFKVVVVLSKRDQIQKFAAFVIPNEEIIRDSMQLSRYIVRFSDLEAVTGMEFFNGPFANMDEKQDVEDVKQLADYLTNDFLGKGSEVGSDGALVLSGPVHNKNLKKKNIVQLKTVMKHICEKGRCDF